MPPCSTGEARRHRQHRRPALEQAGAVHHRLRRPGRGPGLQHLGSARPGPSSACGSPPGQDPSRGHGRGAPARAGARAVRRAGDVHAGGARATRSPTDTSAPAARTGPCGRSARPGARPPVETGMGGSIPFIADLTELYPQAQILVTGVEDPDSRAHRPTNRCTWGTSATRSWPRPCCWPG